jgi:hypothetical protein
MRMSLGGERCFGVDGAGEEAFAERAERRQADAEFVECRQDLGLVIVPSSAES